MNRYNLVILKGSNELKLDNDTFSPNIFYRCLPCEKDSRYRFVVNGIDMYEPYFENNFEFAYDRIIRDWENIGLIVNGKLISKTAFKQNANVHTYGKQTNNLRIIFFGTPRESLYGFYPRYSENKSKQLDAVYDWVVKIVNASENCMEYFDNGYIQFGNKGIPISYGDLGVW